MHRDKRLHDKYTQYPVWLFYWWCFESRHKHSLREFRKTIVTDDETAKRFGRTKSAEPMIEIGKMIDKYKTW